MNEMYLCFEAGESLFLIPLSFVYHIVPGVRDENGRIEFGGKSAEVFDLYGLLTGAGDQERRYAVLMNKNTWCYGFLADQVKGVFTLPDAMLFAVPQEALGTGNSFLKKAGYIESLKSWAFLVGPEWFKEKERY